MCLLVVSVQVSKYVSKSVQNDECHSADTINIDDCVMTPEEMGFQAIEESRK